MATPELTVIFRTVSEMEANIVRGLLATHGIEGLMSSDLSRSVFPFDGVAEVRLSVRTEDATEAERLIADYRDEMVAQVGRIRDEFNALEGRLGYAFRDRGLLEHALTHRSRAHEDVSGGVVDNESLEFLGDAVLGLVVSERLFREFPDYDEGRKSKAKAQLVSTSMLARLASTLRLGEHLLLGRGEEKTGGRTKRSLLADTLEAVVAAIYLDGGYEAASTFIVRQLREDIDQLRTAGVSPVESVDHKSALQEWLQARGRPLPAYRLSQTQGPDHEKLFEVEVTVGEQRVATGEGRTKKAAEQVAAQRALQSLDAPGSS